MAGQPRAAPSRVTAVAVLSVAWPCGNRSLAPAESRSRSPLELTIVLSITGHVGLDHLGRVDDAHELRLRHETELQRRSLEREVVVHRIVSDLRRLVVTDHRRERGYQHQ